MLKLLRIDQGFSDLRLLIVLILVSSKPTYTVGFKLKLCTKANPKAICINLTLHCPRRGRKMFI